jgi:hypothetical protein
MGVWRWRWIAGALLVLVVVAVVVASGLLSEPLRQRVERRMNERLDGYTVRVGGLTLRPLAVGLDLHDVVVVQDANPDPPVGQIGRLAATMQWRALLRLRLVADFRLDSPALYIDRRHFLTEARDDVPVEERGWQDALEAIHPLEINTFSVRDGSLTYVDEGPFRPLELSRINGVLHNIRKVHSEDAAYPSPLEAEAVVFDDGRLVLQGDADLLAAPHPAVRARVDVDDVALGFFQPVLRRYNLEVSRGTLSAAGELEYAPGLTRVELDRVTVRGARANYVHRAETAQAERQRARQAADAAQEATADPELVVRIAELDIIAARLGWTNARQQPAYRVFLDEMDLSIRNLTNQPRHGDSVAQLRGRFMGSGAAAAVLTMRPEADGPDFDLRVALENTDMRRMNDIFRAHGRFDVSEGVFSLYSELSVRNGEVQGYVKPLFGDVKIYDPQQDRDKGLLQRAWERVLDVLARILENIPREEVATVVDLSGPLEDPEASTWQAVVNLLRNAFFDAILPGFERQSGRAA